MKVSASDSKAYAAIPTQAADVFTAFTSGADGVRTSAGAGKPAYLLDNFDPQKQLQLVSSAFAKGCQGCAMTVLPISPANSKPIARQAARAKAYVSYDYLNEPGYNPWDVSPYFVAFVTFNGADAGYQSATALFKAMGGKGNVVALAGTPAGGPQGGTAKLDGMKRALKAFPDIKLLDTQVADYQQDKAQDITQTLITKYGSRLNAIWSANDAMAIGAVQALKAKGLDGGKVLVTGLDGQDDVLGAIKSGDILATVFSSGALMGATTIALSHAAAVGDLKPGELSHAQRKFFLKQVLVTKGNVDKFYRQASNPLFKTSDLTYPSLKKDFWAFSAGPVPEDQ